ncbi:nucleic acid-binding protein [Thermoplasmatales archaeon SG8-52-2]|nr:MAG: nucleic acid-binding protein [Thermoplasmatales archaeon SG8-52-2]
MNKKQKKYVLDTSAILSGKPINLNDSEIVTTFSVSKELSPGGQDYKNFQYLKEKGLNILTPNKETINKVKDFSLKTGDINRLSDTDIEILALALDLKKEKNCDIIILTDDYSIQNVADGLNLKFETINQIGITKRFKWVYRCRGCGKIFKDSIKICPICGTETRNIISNKEDIKNRSDKE